MGACGGHDSPMISCRCANTIGPRGVICLLCELDFIFNPSL